MAKLQPAGKINVSRVAATKERQVGKVGQQIGIKPSVAQVQEKKRVEGELSKAQSILGQAQTVEQYEIQFGKLTAEQKSYFSTPTQVKEKAEAEKQAFIKSNISRADSEIARYNERIKQAQEKIAYYKQKEQERGRDYGDNIDKYKEDIREYTRYINYLNRAKVRYISQGVSFSDANRWVDSEVDNWKKRREERANQIGFVPGITTGTITTETMSPQTKIFDSPVSSTKISTRISEPVASKDQIFFDATSALKAGRDLTIYQKQQGYNEIGAPNIVSRDSITLNPSKVTISEAEIAPMKLTTEQTKQFNIIPVTSNPYFSTALGEVSFEAGKKQAEQFQLKQLIGKKELGAKAPSKVKLEYVSAEERASSLYTDPAYKFIVDKTKGTSFGGETGLTFDKARQNIKESSQFLESKGFGNYKLTPFGGPSIVSAGEFIAGAGVGIAEDIKEKPVKQGLTFAAGAGFKLGFSGFKIGSRLVGASIAGKRGEQIAGRTASIFSTTIGTGLLGLYAFDVGSQFVAAETPEQKGGVLGVAGKDILLFGAGSSFGSRVVKPFRRFSELKIERFNERFDIKKATRQRLDGIGKLQPSEKTPLSKTFQQEFDLDAFRKKSFAFKAELIIKAAEKKAGKTFEPSKRDWLKSQISKRLELKYEPSPKPKPQQTGLKVGLDNSWIQWQKAQQMARFKSGADKLFFDLNTGKFKIREAQPRFKQKPQESISVKPDVNFYKQILQQQASRIKSGADKWVFDTKSGQYKIVESKPRFKQKTTLLFEKPTEFGKSITVAKQTGRFSNINSLQQLSAKRFRESLKPKLTPPKKIITLKDIYKEPKQEGPIQRSRGQQLILEKPKQEQLQSPKQRIITLDKIEPIQKQAAGQRLKTPQRLFSETKLIQLVGEKEIYGLGYRQKSLQLNKQVQRFSQRFSQEQRTKQLTDISFQKSQSINQNIFQRFRESVQEKPKPILELTGKIIPTKEKPPKIPIFGFNGRKIAKKEQAYYAEAKAKGGKKFIRLTEQPVSKAQALDIGSRAADETTARTFRIVPSKKQIPSPTLGGFDWALRQQKFRPYKIRRKAKIQLGNTYIEKTGNAIDTSGEARGLSLAKYIKKRRNPIGNLF